jgi:hypothetical protein
LATCDPDCSIDRLDSTCRPVGLPHTTGYAVRTAAVKTTPNQYAGYSRITRDTKKSRGPRSQQDMQITKPLMTKKISTPSQPYAANLQTPGMMCDTGRPQTGFPGRFTRYVPA